MNNNEKLTLSCLVLCCVAALAAVFATHGVLTWFHILGPAGYVIGATIVGTLALLVTSLTFIRQFNRRGFKVLATDKNSDLSGNQIVAIFTAVLGCAALAAALALTKFLPTSAIPVELGTMSWKILGITILSSASVVASVRFHRMIFPLSALFLVALVLIIRTVLQSSLGPIVEAVIGLVLGSAIAALFRVVSKRLT